MTLHPERPASHLDITHQPCIHQAARSTDALYTLQMSTAETLLGIQDRLPQLNGMKVCHTSIDAMHAIHEQVAKRILCEGVAVGHKKRANDSLHYKKRAEKTRVNDHLKRLTEIVPEIY